MIFGGWSNPQINFGKENLSSWTNKSTSHRNHNFERKHDSNHKWEFLKVITSSIGTLDHRRFKKRDLRGSLINDNFKTKIKTKKMRLMLWNTTQKEKYSAINKSLRKIWSYTTANFYTTSWYRWVSDSITAMLTCVKWSKTFLKAYNFES